MIRLIATDIDGTLLPPAAGRIPEELVQVMRDLSGYGVRIMIASGRPYRGLYNVFGFIGDDLIYNCSNGGCLYCREELIALRPLGTKEDMEYLVGKLRAMGRMFTCDTPSACYVENLSDAIFERSLKAGINMIRTKDVLKIPDIVKISVAYPDGGPDSHKNDPDIQELRRRFQAAPAGEMYLDINPLDGGKGTGIRLVQERFGILPEETAAFGDASNDISMFETTPHSYAVEGAAEDVLLAAAGRIPGPLEGGMLSWMRNLLAEYERGERS